MGFVVEVEKQMCRLVCAQPILSIRNYGSKRMRS